MLDKSIEQVLKENTDRLMMIPGVVGTAIGECDELPCPEKFGACIKILVVELTDELEMKLPKNIEGYPVVIEETGEIRAL
ncbi:MAG: hypothetical protein ABIK27_07925 [Bacteroidota bacterium]